MNSIPFYRDFGVAGELTRRPRGEPAPARRGLLRRVVDAIERSHQRAVERDIARVARDLGLGNPGAYRRNRAPFVSTSHRRSWLPAVNVGATSQRRLTMTTLTVSSVDLSIGHCGTPYP